MRLGRRERAELKALRARAYAVNMRRDMLARKCPEAGPVQSFLNEFGRADRLMGTPPKPGSSLFHGRSHKVK